MDSHCPTHPTQAKSCSVSLLHFPSSLEPKRQDHTHAATCCTKCVKGWNSFKPRKLLVSFDQQCLPLSGASRPGTAHQLPVVFLSWHCSHSDKKEATCLVLTEVAPSRACNTLYALTRNLQAPGATQRNPFATIRCK